MSRVLNGSRGMAARGASRGSRGGNGGARGRGVSNGQHQVQPAQTQTQNDSIVPDIEAGVRRTTAIDVYADW